MEMKSQREKRAEQLNRDAAGFQLGQFIWVLAGEIPWSVTNRISARLSRIRKANPGRYMDK